MSALRVIVLVLVFALVCFSMVGCGGKSYPPPTGVPDESIESK